MWIMCHVEIYLCRFIKVIFGDMELKFKDNDYNDYKLTQKSSEYLCVQELVFK